MSPPLRIFMHPSESSFQSSWARRHCQVSGALERARPVKDISNHNEFDSFAMMLGRMSFTHDQWRQCRKLVYSGAGTPKSSKGLDSFLARIATALRTDALSRSEGLAFLRIVATLTWRQVQAVDIWAQEANSVGRVAARLGIRPPAASRILDRARERINFLLARPGS